MQTIYLIRHAQSLGQARQSELTDLGFSQAKDLVKRFDGVYIDAAFSSPYTRAIQTLEPLCAARGLAITSIDALYERLLHDPSMDLPFPKVIEALKLSYEDWEFALDGGESNTQVADRGYAGLEDILRLGHKVSLAATHGAMISCILGRFDPRFDYNAWSAMKNPHVYKLTFADGILQSYVDLENTDAIQTGYRRDADHRI